MTEYLNEEQLIERYLDSLDEEYKREILVDEVNNWDLNTIYEFAREQMHQFYIDNPNKIDEAYYNSYLEYNPCEVLGDWADANNIRCTNWTYVEEETGNIIQNRSCTCGASKVGGQHSSWCDIN